MNILTFLIIGYLGFTVGPAKVEKAVFGADAMTEVFEVQNFTDDSLRIKVEFEDFSIDETGEVTFYAPGHFVNSLAPRAVVNPEEFVIPPKSIERLRVTFSLPSSEVLAEYYSMLLFKSRPIPMRYSTAINVAGEIGVPVYYTIPQYANKSASFDSFQLKNDSLEIVLSNNGNVHLRIKGEAIITTFDTRIMQQDSLPEFVVMPGNQRRLRIGIDEDIGEGGYLAKIILDYGSLELIVGERKFYK
ncbi:MAG: hypothetical protein OEV79_10550 [candidate division WOR-3 bacterium]|nr:hypothetical protein [candidate division WOR-3 bacterium]